MLAFTSVTCLHQVSFEIFSKNDVVEQFINYKALLAQELGQTLSLTSLRPNGNISSLYDDYKQHPNQNKTHRKPTFACESACEPQSAGCRTVTIKSECIYNGPT